MHLEFYRAAALGLAALLLVFAAPVSADHHEEAAKPMIVKIHADWCGTCQKLEPTFDALETEVGSQAVLVVLDVTDREAVEQSTTRADALGIRAFFDRYKGKTGTVGVLTAKGQPVAVMKGVTDTGPYKVALRDALETS